MNKQCRADTEASGSTQRPGQKRPFVIPPNKPKEVPKKPKIVASLEFGDLEDIEEMDGDTENLNG